MVWGGRPETGETFTMYQALKYQIENQDKSNDDLCEFIANKTELVICVNRYRKRQGQHELFIDILVVFFFMKK